MRELIFVDVESTGLDCRRDKMVEMTWATIDSNPETLYFGVMEVPDFIDELIKFTKRGIAGKTSTVEEYGNFYSASKDATMVAANPAFDAGFLKEYGMFNFHYRMLDIETYAMAKLGLDFMPSMKEIYETMIGLGHDVSAPLHTSLSDVVAMREIYKILETM